MKIEELHEILKKKFKKHVHDIKGISGYTESSPSYKDFYVVKNELSFIIAQKDGRDSFIIWVQNNDKGEECTIGHTMEGTKVIDLVDLILGK